jgi:8-oxo-dGTP pyrophosphatase MutT (NUDIX family)
MRDVRLQAAVIRDNEILILEIVVDDGRRLLLLPGGGREAVDIDERASVEREVREETGAAVIVERLILDVAARTGDAMYQRYHTYLCRLEAGSAPVAGARDGIATIARLQWLRLHDESAWATEILNDHFLYPQLVAIRDALSGARS